MTPENFTIRQTHFAFRNLKSVYYGKVRDVYDLGEDLAIITTDRISAFDFILPRPIPYKGQVLNQIASYFLQEARQICPVWLTSNPDPNVAIGKKCNPIPIEMVVRGYIAGHAWRTYQTGEKMVCGVRMDDNLKEGDKFSKPIITPTTKASSGHDQDISMEELLEQKITDSVILEKMVHYSLDLYSLGAKMAEEKGLLLVDTKYEFGLHNGELTLMDEIHTPDSSRYYIADGYTERQNSGEKQIQLSKEFVREWLMAHGFQGQEDQFMPEMPDSFVWEISRRYIELYERITGRSFQMPDPSESIEARIRGNLKDLF